MDTVILVKEEPASLYLICHCQTPFPSGYHAAIVAKESTFAEIASKESDCNSARRGGDLGPFGRGQMQSQ